LTQSTKLRFKTIHLFTGIY